MKNKIYYICVLIISSIIVNCSSKSRMINNVSCKGLVNLQYDINKNGNGYPLANKNSNAFTVYFLNDFKDSIQGFVNNKLYYNKYLKLDGKSDNMKDYFGYNYSKDITTPILKIESKSRNICFDIEIDKKYKLIYVFLSEDGKWTVRFSNLYYGR